MKKTYSVDLIYDAMDPNEEMDIREASAGNGTEATANDLFSALKSVGYNVCLIPVVKNTYKKVITTLTGDIVFNQVEEDELGFEVLNLLEKLHKPVTGIDSAGYAFSWHKTKIKEKLIEADVATPDYFVATPGRKTHINLKYPLFVKAADDHGSLSINSKSCVKNEKELWEQVAWIKEKIGDDSLVEEYIDGRELSVTLLGNGESVIVLPVKEIIFGREFLDKPKVITYDAKWSPETSDYNGTLKMNCPAKLSAKEQAVIEINVKKASRALKCRDYVRFDIRLKDNIPYIIDYNANPALGPMDASALQAKAFGLTYPEFISSIVSVAMARYNFQE